MYWDRESLFLFFLWVFLKKSVCKGIRETELDYSTILSTFYSCLIYFIKILCGWITQLDFCCLFIFQKDFILKSKLMLHTIQSKLVFKATEVLCLSFLRTYVKCISKYRAFLLFTYQQILSSQNRTNYFILMLNQGGKYFLISKEAFHFVI